MGGLQAVLFCSEFLISSLREESATNESREPKTGREAKRLCLTSQRTWRESNPLINRYSIFTTKRRDFSEPCPVILFPDYRLAESCQEWADTLLLTRGQRFRSRTSPDCQSLNYRDCPVPLHLEQGLDVHAPRPPTP